MALKPIYSSPAPLGAKYVVIAATAGLPNEWVLTAGDNVTFDTGTDGVVKISATGGGGSSTLAGLSDVTITSPSKSEVLQYNGTDWVNVAVSVSGLANIVEDTTPQIGGDLDLNGFGVTSDGDAASTITLSANYDNTYSPFAITNSSKDSNSTSGFTLSSGTAATFSAYAHHDTATTYIYGSTGALLIGTGGNTSFKIQTGLTDRVTISGDGNTVTLEDAAAWRTGLGLVIGTNVQAYDADLTTWAGLTPSANAQSLVTAANYAAMRTLLDLEAGTDFYSISAADTAFQPKDSDLTTIASLTATTDNFIVSVSSAWASRTPAQVRATLDLEAGTDFPSLSTFEDHSARHESGGSDAIKLDDLAAPDDNTDLNASASAHGLLPKLSNSASDFLNGKGAWAVPSGGSASNSFETISVSGQDDVVADSATDTLTLVGAGGITITTDKTTDTVTFTGPSLSSYLTSIPTGNTLWVDAVNGDDGTGTSDRQDLPYLTPEGALADAVSGDLIIVRPGAYTTVTDIAADGRNWHFEAGATVAMTLDDFPGIWDGDGTESCVVTGHGEFSRDSTEDMTDPITLVRWNSTGALHLECQSLHVTAVSSIDAGAFTVYPTGPCVVRVQNITAEGENASAVWWTYGEMDVVAGKIELSDASTGTAVHGEIGSPGGGDGFVRAQQILSSSTDTVSMDGTETTGAMWVESLVIKNTGTGRSVYQAGSCRLYVRSQKLFGLVQSDDGLLYVLSDKISAIVNGSSGAPSLYYGAGGDAYINVTHWDVGSYTGESIKITGGTHRISGMKFTGGSSAKGIEITGGTLILDNCTIDTSANSSTQPIVKSGGTLTLNNCTLIAEGSVNAIEAGTAQNVAGFFSANRPLHANVTVTGSYRVGTLTAVAFVGPLTGNVTGNASGSSGSCTGNAATATKWAATINVNGVALDGSGNITVTVPISTGVSGLGTGIATALAVNTGSAGAPVLFNGALGTPSSGTVTNLTGTASININGTVGATTPAAATFTTVAITDATSLLLGQAGKSVGDIGFRNATSGTITLSPAVGALGTVTQYLQASNGTIYCSGGADVAVADGGTGLSSGTSGGVLAFTASGTIASSGALAANALVIGGGAGVAPSTTTTGTGVLTALGNAVNSAGGPVTGGAITSSALTMTTARLLGRTTASTGAVEEITAAARFSLSSTTLDLTTALRTQTVTAVMFAVDDNVFIRVPYAGTIAKATISGFTVAGEAVSGSAVVDIWKDTTANYPPTIADTITASAKPTISSSSAPVTDSTLTGWTTSVAAGDWLVFNLDSVTTFGMVVVNLEITRS